MMMKRENQNKIILPSDGDDVRRFLTYNDRSVAFQLSRLKQMHHYKRNSPEKFLEAVAKLKSEENKCLLFHDENGNPWTYAGLWLDLQKRFGWKCDWAAEDIDGEIIPWKKIPFDMRYYQKAAFESLCELGQGAVELPTGSGKSLIILNLLKRYGIKALVVTPFTEVTTQLRGDMETAFGAKYVGQYGGGRKKTDKLFTVANAQSVTRIEEGSKAWEDLSQCQMVIFDESHMVPAGSFSSICLNGVVKDAPLRFFVSATQTRTDGSELLLKGITGPVLYKKTYKELADEGFLKKLNVKLFKVNAAKSPQRDPKKETRNQLYNNPNVAKLAAMLAEKAVKVGKRQTIILINEYEQFLLLKNYMRVSYEFAHGTVSKEVKQKLPEEYWKCDIKDTVSRFNNGEIDVLIGTTAISTGVDIKPTGCLIYLQGGSSEIKLKQGIGRGTRPVAHEDLWVCDFIVNDSPIMERHASVRTGIYDTLTDIPIKVIG